MKTLFLLQKHLLKGCLLLLFVSGCVKEPGPDIPLPARKPEWLLVKYTEVKGHVLLRQTSACNTDTAPGTSIGAILL